MPRCFRFIVSIIVLTMLQTPSFHQIKGSDFQVMELYSSPHNSKATEGKEASSLTASSIYPLRTSLKSGGNSEIYEPRLRSLAKESSKTSRSHSPLISHRISGLSVKQKSLIRLVKRSDYSSLKRLAHTISPAEANTRDEQGKLEKGEIRRCMLPSQLIKKTQFCIWYAVELIWRRKIGGNWSLWQWLLTALEAHWAGSKKTALSTCLPETSFSACSPSLPAVHSDLTLPYTDAK